MEFRATYKNKIAIVINLYCYYFSAPSTYFVPVSIYYTAYFSNFSGQGGLLRNG